jgi:hypothetical protein
MDAHPQLESASNFRKQLVRASGPLLGCKHIGFSRRLRRYVNLAVLWMSTVSHRKREKYSPKVPHPRPMHTLLWAQWIYLVVRMTVRSCAIASRLIWTHRRRQSTEHRHGGAIGVHACRLYREDPFRKDSVGGGCHQSDGEPCIATRHA